ncbi:spherulation-specific family 4 protein [Thermoflexus sp.]|uniref:spherulation-specific family 4 protein n=1 Tax=Thermoflexus sp. TaxID=1969742 RepID=UPI0025DD4A01|nr:spherulation-specific family 4 protein [Thermoflexus sp.]MDW8180272.1 spherulation-specific family 4 protein [Anaerolineae bacterium]MCS6963642.1 spherulation-specific family 4 protein [Thermoflexus sp.]MCS7350821.1 spherulation-specific family 4 protein [Thermoflexus sp.]MCX7690359.1 spherulation-specific family 4 protein [Thermoflexus sp.]MDW8185011.1 spherulation-specific family 4 protein [Anaerolineae bacterium]
MTRSWTLALVLAGALAAMGPLGWMEPRPARGAGTPVLRVAVPAYWDPEPGAEWPGLEWRRLLNGTPLVGMVVINPDNGPGSSPDPAYSHLVQAARIKGIRVLGYVYTQYGTRPLSSVQLDISRHYSWHAVDGIFLDEASTDCAREAFYYRPLYNWIKTTYGPTQVVALNPGTQTNECYVLASDVLLTFEEACVQDASANDCSNYRSWALAGWETNYPPDRFWHLVYDVPAAYLANVLAKARSSHVRWVYVTSDGGPNPWDTLPTYWELELTLLGLRRAFLPLIHRGP